MQKHLISQHSDLDQSKAFDKVNWTGSLARGVSAHLIWLMQSLYYEQRGQTWMLTTSFQSEQVFDKEVY